MAALLPRSPTSGTTTPGAGYTIAAILTEASTTITALQVPSTTGLLIVDGTTLTWRQKGLTLPNGDVISAGFNGLVDSTTTAMFTNPLTIESTLSNGQLSSLIGNLSTTKLPPIGPYTSLPSVLANSSGILTIQTINPYSNTHRTHPTVLTSTTDVPPAQTSGGGSGSGSGSGGSSSSTGAAAAPTRTMGAAKVIALLGVVGGMFAVAV